MENQEKVFWRAWMNREVYLEGKDLLAMSVVCSEFFRLVKPFVENKFRFTLSKDSKLCVYSPKSFTVRILGERLLPENGAFVLDLSKFKLIEEQSYYFAVLARSFPTSSMHLIPRLDHYLYEIEVLQKPLSSVTVVNFGFLFNQPIDDIPSTVRHLKFGAYFNQNIDHLPSSVEVLLLESFTFNQPLDHLPHALLELRIAGRDFNQPVDHLPLSLLELGIFNSVHESMLYNLPLDHLPQSLQYLRVDSGFNQPLDYLPQSLHTLDLSLAESYHQPLDYLPSSLRHLCLSVHFQRSLDYLPPLLSLRFIYACFCCKERLSLGRTPPERHGANVADWFGISAYLGNLDNLPATLQTLVLQSGCVWPLDHLPSSLKSLYLWYPDGDLVFTPNLPSTLAEFHVCWKDDKLPDQLLEMTKALPSSITVIYHARAVEEQAEEEDTGGENED